eukprot:6129664-Pyramimonas_sp.AAC.3
MNTWRWCPAFSGLGLASSWFRQLQRTPALLRGLVKCWLCAAARGHPVGSSATDDEHGRTKHAFQVSNSFTFKFFLMFPRGHGSWEERLASIYWKRTVSTYEPKIMFTKSSARIKPP